MLGISSFFDVVRRYPVVVAITSVGGFVISTIGGNLFDRLFPNEFVELRFEVSTSEFTNGDEKMVQLQLVNTGTKTVSSLDWAVYPIINRSPKVQGHACVDYKRYQPLEYRAPGLGKFLAPDHDEIITEIGKYPAFEGCDVFLASVARLQPGESLAVQAYLNPFVEANFWGSSVYGEGINDDVLVDRHNANGNWARVTIDGNG